MKIKQSKAYKFYKYRLWQLCTYPYFYTYTSRPVQVLLNRKYRQLYKRSEKKPLSDVQTNVLKCLEKDGIAITHIDKLIKPVILKNLQISSRELINQQSIKNIQKSYQSYFLNSGTEAIDCKDIFLQFATQQAIFDIVSAYFQMHVNLRHLSGAITFPVVAGSLAESSQKWHRDPGTYTKCKVFLYLTDVDEKSGPFNCLAGSQPGGRWSKICPHRFFGLGSYYPPVQKIESGIKKYGAEKDIKTCTGPAGTIIFCNTMALHKGGYSVSKERIMITAQYSKRLPESKLIEFSFRKE